MESNTAKNFVLQLGSLIALYVSLTAIITVLFGVINIAFPDAVDSYWQYDSAQSSIRYGIAMLIVFFPTYLVLTRMVNQVRRTEGQGAYLTLTKWLIYLSLLLGGAILLGDFVAVILTYLNGEITTRFLLKAFSLLVVIGAAFTYYIFDARGYWKDHETKSKQYGMGVVAVVAVVLFLGFYNNDTPAEVREMRLDNQQISDLQEMQYRIEEYYRVEAELPENATDLFTTGAPAAPEDRAAYEYRVIDETSYELCATFARSSSNNERTRPVAMPYGENNYNWEHKAGEQCFKRVVTPNNENAALIESKLRAAHVEEI